MQIRLMRILSVLLLILMILNVQVMAGGKIFLGGGALQDQNNELWQALHDATGKDKPIIAVFCSAEGSLKEAKAEYYEDTEKYLSWENLFKKYNFEPVFIPIAIDNADEAAYDKNNIKKVASSDVIWFNGGNQNFHVDSLVENDGSPSPLLQEVYKVYDNGAIVGGTSAGTAIMCNPMIGAGKSLGALLDGVTDEDNYSDPEDNRVFLRNGFDFFQEGIVDQHFIKRGRLGRLVRAAYFTESNFGIGVDENTAALIDGDSIEVYGENGVLVFNFREMVIKKDSHFKKIKLHYLTQGDKLDIVSGKYETNPAKDLSLVGNEYYAGNQLNSNVFGIDAVSNMLTEGLLDNTETKAQGIAFRMISDSKAEGVKLIFKETENSEGYFGKVDGENTYTVYNILLEIVPIKMSIESNL